MTSLSSNDLTIGIYVPSYKRADVIKTDRILNDCTYVVRKSEEDMYRQAGVRKLLAADDDQINSLPKIRQWIIDNAPEDIVVQIDDDLDFFAYVNKINFERIEDPDIVDGEIERVAQMLVDLNIGFASIDMQLNVIKYSREFEFKSTIGTVCWFNKQALKSRYDTNVTTKGDIDFELQELLRNRIILIPSYFRVKAMVDKNKGGANVGKNSAKVKQNVDYLKTKWGKYYCHDYTTNKSKVKVNR